MAEQKQATITVISSKSARIINDKQYLVSPNFSVINEIGESDIDFSKVSNINGIYFDYDEDDKLWKITCMNPYVVFT